MTYRSEVHPDFSDFAPLLPDIATHFDTVHESIHKARNELRIVPMLGRDVVVKAFKIPHLLNRIVYGRFRASKAAKSFHNARELEKRGIATPQPVGYIEFYERGLFSASYYLSLHLPYDFTIREAFHHAVDDCEAVLDAFADFTRTLHDRGVWHVDYSPGNILVGREDGGYRFSLVDINRMQFKHVSPEEGLKNFAKFWARDEDLERLARRYAAASGFDPERAVAIARQSAAALQAKTRFKQRLKGKR